MIDLCSSPEPDEAEAGPSSRPEKRKAVDIGGDDVILAAPNVAGPSKRARCNQKTAQVDEDIAVLNDSTTNPNRDLPHSRETCADHPFFQCFCVVCDKPASECTQWGDGLSPANHCNAKAATCKQPAKPAAAAARPLAAPPAMRSPPSSPEMDGGLGMHGFGFPGYYSDDSMDEERCSNCGIAPYDCDGECCKCGHYRTHDPFDCGYSYGYLHTMTPGKRNPWLYQNDDAIQYQMSKEASHHLQKPITRKRVPVKISSQELKDASKLGTIHFPVQVSAATFKKVQAQLAAAPYGYQDDYRAASLRDWRSWQAVLDEKWSLPAVMFHTRRATTINQYLTQAFEQLQKQEKSVKLPQMPKESIKVLPVEGVKGPEEPPVKTTLRSCLLIDCTSSQKPQFVGVHTTSQSTMKDVKRAVAEIIGKKFNDEDSALDDGTMLLCGESHCRDARLVLHRDVSRLDVYKGDMENGWGDRVSQGAWLVQVPIMVATWKTSDGAAVSSLKSNGLEALATKVTAVLRRWGVLDNVSSSRLSHLKEQFFSHRYYNSCTVPEYGDVIAPMMTIDRMRRHDRLQHDTAQLMVQALPTLSANPVSGGYMGMEAAVKIPHALVAALVLDKLNLKLDQDGLFKIDVKAPLKQDLLLTDLMSPKCHTSVSEHDLKLHREYVERRRRIADQCRKVKALTEHAMHEIVQQTTDALGSGTGSRPGFAHTSLVDKGGGKHALCVDIYLTSAGRALSDLEYFPKPPPTSRGRRRFYQEGMDHTHPMKNCLEIILNSNQEWQAMNEQLKRGNRHVNLSLGNIMSTIEASPDLPSMIQPVGLHDITLHEYQKQSLKWMIDMENTPLRSKLWVPVNSESDIWYSPALHKLTKGVPEGSRGGILAEEMGLGKTVEILSLVLAMPASDSVVNGTQLQTPSGKLVQSRGTLVVCKVSLVGQWVTEARSKLADKTLKIVEYHGPNRIRNLKQLAEHDIVVTTYETLSSDSLGRTKKCSGDANPVPRIHWHRVVLDESHAIKDQSTKSFKAIDAIQSTCRWACTGTPINTDVKDLSGQFAALHMQPLGAKSFQQGMLARGFFDLEKELLLIMRTLIMRHSKKSVQESGAWSLPPKTEQLVPVTFTNPEWLCSGGRHSLSSLTVAAPDLQQPLIEAAPGPVENLPLYPKADDMECAICFETYEIPVRTNCGHWFCKECIKDALAMNAHCPLCRRPAKESQLKEAEFPANEPEPEPEAEAEASTSRRGSSTHIEMDSKMKELVKQLRQMHASDASNKALIFTQYNSTLEFVAKQLRENGFTCRCISGKMPMKQRAAAIEAFQSDPPTTVFVLSVRAAAVGITLTSANYIFMVEPLLNCALDDQAVGRAWRMGQKRPVTVKRLYIKGSVEEAIMQVAKDRQGSGYVPTTARQKQNVGALTADKASLRLEEMRTLFAAPKPPTGL